MTDEVASPASSDGGPPIPVCPRCIGEVFPFVDFCPRCRTPLTSFANTGPLESALSEGWGMGEAIVTKHPRLVTLIGVWLLLTPIMAGMTGVVISESRRHATTGGLVSRVWAGVVLAFAGWALVHATRNFLRSRRSPG